jgi:hypothetical protein
MADTFESRGINSVVWTSVPRPKIREFRADGSDIKPGLIVTVENETDPDIDLCANGETPLGIVLERYDVDIDTAYDDNDEHVPVLVFKENRNVGVWVYVVESIAIARTTRYKAVAGEASTATEGTTEDKDICLLGAETQSADNTNVKLRKFWIES